MGQTSVDTLVIGAGPFGLSLSAHLRNTGVEHLVLGRPMDAWHRMPKGMCLRSPARASSLSDPAGVLTIEAFYAAHGLTLEYPVPLEHFLAYGQWFVDRAGVEVDDRFVTELAEADGGFFAQLDDGDEVLARRVVLAAGADSFQWIPPEFRALSPEVASHPGDHADLGVFAGKKLVVLGAGQSGIESAALAHEQGANVTVAFRAEGIRWLTRSARLHSTPVLNKMLYSPTDVGPAGLSRVVSAPELFRQLPLAAREKAIKRCTRPAAAAWLIDRTKDVTVEAGQFRGVAERPGGVRIACVDGRAIEADHLLMCTGYRVDLSRYSFLSPDLVGRIETLDGYPVLRRGLASSVPGLHIIGWPSVGTFGPVMRHVCGTDFTSHAVAASLASSRRSLASRVSRRPIQYHFDAESYVAEVNRNVPHYRELQAAVAEAAKGADARSVLDLGIGTGETSAAVIEVHPEARITGVDASADMLALAQKRLPSANVAELVVSKLQDPLPPGKFDLIVTSLAVHHLTGRQKRDLFARIHEVLAPGRCFVLADIVRPPKREDAVTPTSRRYDRPERASDLEQWLTDAGFAVRRNWTRHDLVVFRAEKSQAALQAA